MKSYHLQVLLASCGMNMTSPPPRCQANSECQVLAKVEEESPETGLGAITGAELRWLKVGIAAFFLLEAICGTFLPLVLVQRFKNLEGSL